MRLCDSTIDFPRPTLSPFVWDQEGDEYTLKPTSKAAILSALSQIPTDGEIVRCRGIHLVGSLCTNQYTDTTDVDIHIQLPEDSKFTNEAQQKRVKKWFDENRDRIGAYIGTHPIEVYIQLNPSQDMMSDGVYDVVKDVWLKGPKISELSYDPYDDFSDVYQEVKQLATQMDIQLGELKRGVIDFKTISDAIKQLPAEQRKELLKQLEKKRDELESVIRNLYKVRRVYIDKRHESSKPVSEEEARNDTLLAQRWRDANAVHKFMHRYRYTKLIGDLATFLQDDDKLSNTEVDKIQRMLDVKNDTN